MVVGRPSPDDVLFISNFLCRESETGTDGLFFGGVDIIFVTNIGDNGDAHIFQDFGGVVLGFPEFGPIAVTRSGGNLDDGTFTVFVPRSQLNGEERKFRLVEILTPIQDHLGEQVTVLPCSAGVGFALIPDRSGNAVREQGGNHAVVKLGGFPAEAWPVSGHGFAGRLGFSVFFFP